MTQRPPLAIQSLVLGAMLAGFGPVAGSAQGMQPAPKPIQAPAPTQPAPPAPPTPAQVLAPTPPPPAAARRLLPGESLVCRFEVDPARSSLKGWAPARTGPAQSMGWRLEDLSDSPSPGGALALASPTGKGNAFNLCVYTGVRTADVAASAWIKPFGGEEDRGGGLAWRIESTDGPNADNYYCARWNPLEDNFRLYVVKGGKRTQLATIDVRADHSSWHAVSVSHVGKRIEATLDGGARITADDDTFTAPGMVGLWTKADASSAFDDVSIADATPEPATIVDTIKRDARLIGPLVKSDLARAFLAAARELPAVEPRTIYYDRDARKALSSDDAAKLTGEQRAKLREIKVDETYYYYTRYGSPLAYARALDLASGDGGVKGASFRSAAGTRVLDFGYGTIGHLRLLATLGATCSGVDVDPTLEVTYGRLGDTGKVGNGSISLLTGRWPGDAKLRAAAGDGLDLFISKNTLKRGYVHPEREADERMLVKLGVSDEEFVKAVSESLKPGGLMVIYNICPAMAPADQPYIPWADGRCPFPRELLESSGLEVLAYDVVDNDAAREQGRALGWHKGEHPMDLEKDLFAWYTIARKK